MLNKLGDFGFKLGTIFLVILTLVIIVIALLGLFGAGFGYLLSNWVFNWVTTNLGFDYHAANFATAVIVFLIWTVVPSLMWKFWLRKRRMWNGLAVVAFYGAIWLMVSTVGNGVCFDRKTGKPQCYFIDTPSGRKWSRTPGFDPSSGKPFQLFTREIKEREDRAKNSENQPRKEISRSKTDSSDKIQPLPNPPITQNRERTATTEEISKKQNKQSVHPLPKDAEVSIADEKHTETFPAVQPQNEIQPNRIFNNEPLVVQSQSIPPHTIRRETNEIEIQQVKTVPTSKDKVEKKDNPVKTALKNSAFDLVNIGLGRLKRKIQ